VKSFDFETYFVRLFYYNFKHSINKIYFIKQFKVKNLILKLKTKTLRFYLREFVNIFIYTNKTLDFIEKTIKFIEKTIEFVKKSTKFVVKFKKLITKSVVSRLNV